MISYYNTNTGERVDSPDELRSTLEHFDKIYYNVIPLEYDSVLVTYLNRSSMLEIKVKESISQFRDQDYFYTKVDGQIALGRCFLGETYLIRANDMGRSIFIHTLDRNVDPSKSEYYRLDPAEWRAWVDLLMAEVTTKLTSNI